MPNTYLLSPTSDPFNPFQSMFNVASPPQSLQSAPKEVVAITDISHHEAYAADAYCDISSTFQSSLSLSPATSQVLGSSPATTTPPIMPIVSTSDSAVPLPLNPNLDYRRTRAEADNDRRRCRIWVDEDNDFHNVENPLALSGAEPARLRACRSSHSASSSISSVTTVTSRNSWCGNARPKNQQSVHETPTCNSGAISSLLLTPPVSTDQRRHSSYMPCESVAFLYCQGVRRQGSLTGRASIRSSDGSDYNYSSNNHTDQSNSSSNNTGSHHNTMPHFKTEFCVRFRESGGRCPFGERCQFVHHDYELQRRSRALTYKTRHCWSGEKCPYQQNHARCIYLHADETAEMFDRQRGISFDRVKKILANKESKNQRKQYAAAAITTGSSYGLSANAMNRGGLDRSYSTGSTIRRERIECHASSSVPKDPPASLPLNTSFELDPSLSKDLPPLLKDLPSLPTDIDVQPSNIPDLSESSKALMPGSLLFSSLATIPISSPPSCNYGAAVAAPTSSSSAWTPKPLTIMLPSPYTPPSRTSEARSTLPDLFSPGTMPEIQVPFSSQEQLDGWEDPCFDGDPDQEEQDAHRTLMTHDPKLWAYTECYPQPQTQLPSLSDEQLLLGQPRSLQDQQDALETLQLQEDEEEQQSELGSLPLGVVLRGASVTNKYCSMTDLLSGIMRRRTSVGSHLHSALSLRRSTNSGSSRGGSEKTPVSPVGHYKLW